MLDLPRVVHFTTVHNGTDTRIFFKECVSLAKAGFSVTLIFPGDKRTNVEQGVTCRALPIPRRRLLRITLGQLRMLSEVIGCRADLYHFHDPELLFSGLALRALGRAVVFDSHEHISRDLGEKEWLHPWARFVARLAGKVIERVADRFMSGVVVTTPGMAKSYPRGPTVLLRNFPQLEEFSDAGNWDRREDMICYVGSVAGFRGSRQIARLALRVSSRVVVAGPFSGVECLKAAAEPGWSRVEYRGVLDRDEVVRLLGQAKVGLAILLPMENFEDSIPTKLLEYMASGVPVVASNFQSWRALVGEVECVAFVNPFDDEEIAGAVNAILMDPSRAERMGAAGRELVLERFTWEQEFPHLLELYRRVLE